MREAKLKPYAQEIKNWTRLASSSKGRKEMAAKVLDKYEALGRTRPTPDEKLAADHLERMHTLSAKAESLAIDVLEAVIEHNYDQFEAKKAAWHATLKETLALIDKTFPDITEGD